MYGLGGILVGFHHYRDFNSDIRGGGIVPLRRKKEEKNGVRDNCDAQTKSHYGKVI